MTPKKRYLIKAEIYTSSKNGEVLPLYRTISYDIIISISRTIRTEILLQERFQAWNSRNANASDFNPKAIRHETLAGGSQG